MARPPSWHARRALSGLTAALALAACGGDEPSSDPEAVAKMLRDAAAAAGKSDSEAACGHLTDRAQTQIVLQTGGRLGNADCSQAVGRALLFLSPEERTRIGSLEPSGIRLAGDSGSAVMRSTAGGPQQPIVVEVSVRKDGDDWKIEGFGENTQAPGF